MTEKQPITARATELPLALYEWLERVESMLVILVERQTVKDWYSVEEFARLVGKAEFTVREWCRHRRVCAEKKDSGRGSYSSWAISHTELLRYQREGLRKQSE
jgi:hypothetical protein